jgi:hypothetical protein
LRGELREREIPVGPGDRLGLSHVLITDDAEIPIYSAGVTDILRPFVGRRVEVTGKLIDLSGEGGGTEVWIGQIELLEPSPQE